MKPVIAASPARLLQDNPKRLREFLSTRSGYLTRRAGSGPAATVEKAPPVGEPAGPVGVLGTAQQGHCAARPVGRDVQRSVVVPSGNWTKGL